MNRYSVLVLLSSFCYIWWRSILWKTNPFYANSMCKWLFTFLQAVVLILESEHTPDVKEQAVCILGNIADGDSAKKLIIDNEDMLRKLTTYMLHNDTKLQIAAVVCIQNLIWRNDEGSSDRQLKLKEIGWVMIGTLINLCQESFYFYTWYHL